MSGAPKDLEKFWDDLLSRQPGLIRATFATLDDASQKSIRTHLERMAREAGWQPEQRASAKAALKALTDRSDKEK